METAILFDLIEKLPADKKKAVEDLVSVLISDINVKDTPSNEKQRMQFGDLKGFVTCISDDFDEPLEDFKDYM
jgi:hypothetical protein